MCINNLCCIVFVGPWTGDRVAIAFYKSDTQPKEDKFPYIEQIYFVYFVPYLNLFQDFPDVEKSVRRGEPITENVRTV